MPNKATIMLQLFFFTTLLVSTGFGGCLEEQQESDEEQILPIPVPIDVASVLPNWADGQYHDYGATVVKLNTFEDSFPELVDVFSIGKSNLGKDIWCIRLTNEENKQEKLSCLIDGCIHGNEWEAGDACLYIAEYLLINYGANQTVTSILDEIAVYIVPLVNPDGRQQNTRWNANSIDLNRNFDVDFGRLRGHSLPLGKIFGRIEIPYLIIPRFGSLTNAGRKPFSEPESQAMKALMTNLVDEHFSFYINCHTAVHNFITPWSAFKPPFEITSQEKNVFSYARQWVATYTEYEDTPLSYSASGTVTDWCFKEFHVPCFTFELLSKEYEPWIHAGRHDHLVHWMNTTLPVFLYLFENTENLYQWEIPDNQPCLPEGVPPPPLH